MALHKDFPADPYVILDPDHRWFPGDDQGTGLFREQLIPPLVDKIRRGVAAWRQAGYPGASDTSRALLRWWFDHEHIIWGPDGATLWQWYFAQREAVESVVWLYEVEGARDPYSLIRYDGSGILSQGMFDEHWTRYVIKLATGVGKTKVASLLIAWSYFHKRYEPDSPLSTNILLVAPNIIVLDRLRTDFDGCRVFYSDPILPTNGWEGRDWQADFQLSVHVQDEIGHVSANGNLFLTNIHRVDEGGRAPPAWDLREQFLGPKPVAKTTDSKTDLGVIVRSVPDLLVVNDEAHHVRKGTAWFRQMEELHAGLLQKGGRLSAQLDLSATPKHDNGALFPQVVADFPLVEAIAQQIVKTPVLPDEASRSKLAIRQSDQFVEQFQDHLDLGVVEWRRVHEDMKRVGKKAILFVMTDNTANCDSVAEWLGQRYAELSGKVLVIHTNKSGDIDEGASNKAAKAELDILRRESREIDGWESPYLAVVSVMVLREGWDVRGVTTIVGLRPYASPARILPEQTLGRGLRKMFPGRAVKEQVSVIGTPAFLEFVESIRSEGVELEQRPMGAGSEGAGPMVIEVDRQNPDKDIEALDISLPKLKPRIERQYYRLADLDVGGLSGPRLPVKLFTADELREIVFRDIHKDEVSHTVLLDAAGVADWRNMVGWFAQRIKTDLRLVGGFDVLFEKVKAFIEDGLFAGRIDVSDPNIMRNLSEPGVTGALFETLKAAINQLTIHDSGETRVVDRIKLSESRAQVTRRRETRESAKTMMNVIAGDSGFELEFAEFLDAAPDVVAFVKNSEATNFTIEYQASGGGIVRDYRPDFVVRDVEGTIWIIETKGREDLDDLRKRDRLMQWCEDASVQDAPNRYRALYVRQEDWMPLLSPLNSLEQAAAVFR